MSSCIVYNVQYLVVHICICFVTTELSCRQSCVPKCWPTRHIPLRQSRPCKPRACFRFRPSLRVDPFLRWPALNSFSSTHRFQLGKTMSPLYLGNARSGPSPSRWPAFVTLPTLAKLPLVWRRLCHVVLFPSCLTEHTLTAIYVLLSRGSSVH